MIKENNFVNILKKNFIPPYIQIFISIKKITSIPIIIQIILIVSIHFYLTLIVVKKMDVTEWIPEFWSLYFFCILFLICGFSFMAYMWNKHIQAFKELLTILSSQKQIEELKKIFHIMYKTKSQLWTFLVFALTVTLVFYYVYPPLPTFLKIFLSIFLIFPCSGLGGLGARLALTSIIFVYKFTKFKNVKLNPINPGETTGLIKLSKLMALYATLYIIQNTLYLFPYVYFSLRAHHCTPPIDLTTWAYKTISSIVIVFFFILIPTYFIYPQLILRNFIIFIRNEILKNLELYVEKLFYNSNETKKKYDMISKYEAFFFSVKNSSTIPIDFLSSFKFIVSLAFSLFLILSSEPKIFSSIVIFFTRILFYLKNF